MSSKFTNLLLLSGAAILIGGCALSPTPLTSDHVQLSAQDRLDRVTAQQEPIAGAIDLYEAMARALKYNLDYGVEDMQAALRVSELDLSHWNLLPNATANFGRDGRNKVNASSSFNIFENKPNFGASTSQDRIVDTDNIQFSWNILDFGLSYFRARQAADQVLIAEELRRKVALRIAEDVRTAYWRAVSADRLVNKLKALEGRTKTALANTREIYNSRETSLITALTYERELVEIKRTLEELQRELSIAKLQLAALMNVDPGTNYQLVVPGRRSQSLPLRLDAQELIWTALKNRPELREVDYQLRINAQEANTALLELLPGFSTFAGDNYDGNSFLLHDHWIGWGAKASWNLLKVVQYPAKTEVIESQDRLLDQRGLALSMAIMTQVHVSRARYFHFSKELKTSAEYLDVQTRLLQQMRAEAQGDRISEQTLIREEMNTLVAEVKYDIAYASLQNAYANVYASIGVEPYDGSMDLNMGVKDLAAALKQLWFARGDFAHGMKVADAAK